MADAVVDVVAILDSNLLQVFETARPVKASVKEDSKVPDHPLETGASTSDHIIFLPVEIEISMMLTGDEVRTVYQQIKAAFKAGQLFTVQTRSDSYKNMLIQGMPHEEATDMFNVLPLAFKLRNIVFIQPQYAALKARKPKNTTKVDRGEQQATPATTKKKSVLSGFFH